MNIMQTLLNVLVVLSLLKCYVLWNQEIIIFKVTSIANQYKDHPSIVNIRQNALILFLSSGRLKGQFEVNASSNYKSSNLWSQKFQVSWTKNLELICISHKSSESLTTFKQIIKNWDTVSRPIFQSWTSSERLMYVQFTSCVYGVAFLK